MRIILGIFTILHGLIHLVYFGHSMRYFDLKPGLAWPDESWVFIKLLGNIVHRNFAGILLILAAIALITGGAGMLFNQAWWLPLVVGGAALSTLVFIIFWDGRIQNLDGQGLIGILINIAILVAALIFRWPVNE